MQRLAANHFEAIVRDTHVHLRAYIAGLGVTGHDVDDLAQDVYIELYRNLNRIPDDVPVERWLKGIARNLSMNFFRRRARRGRLHRQALVRLLASSDDPWTTADGDLQAALEGCLERLPAESRRLVDLRYERELPSADIARKLNCSAEAVRVSLFRIRARLKQCITRHLAELQS